MESVVVVVNTGEICRDQWRDGRRSKRRVIMVGLGCQA